MLETIRTYVLGGGTSDVVYECRDCGTVVEDDVDECPSCGAGSIVRYDID